MLFRSGLRLGSIAFLLACPARDEADRADITDAARYVVSLTAAEYSFRAPDSTAAGWITFRLTNHGEEVHYGHIVVVWRKAPVAR